MIFKEWEIIEDEYKQDYLAKTESIFALGNGALAVRATNEEMSISKKHNMFLAGVFNKANPEEVTELANIPDVTGLELKVNGKLLIIDESNISNYQKSLNLKTNLVKRSFSVKLEEGNLNFEFKKFISHADRNLYMQKLRIESDVELEIEMVSGIDGTVTNSGSQHFYEGEKRLYNDILSYSGFTTENKYQVTTLLNNKFTVNVDQLVVMKRRKIQFDYKFLLSPETPIELEKASYHYVGTPEEKLEEFQEITNNTFEENLHYHSIIMDRFWELNDIVMKTTEKIKCVSRYSQLMLLNQSPAHTPDCNIGAKGMTGEGYKGHAFWDTEIFMLSYFVLTNKKKARNLVKYRYLGLEGARKKAKDNGYSGAMFPWESASPECGEVTPLWGAADIVTGKPIKIMSGILEQHITADVSYGIWLYNSVHNDEEFMNKYGYEVVLDAAKFWSSRVELKEATYQILDVIGPDEYKENIDNNTFTNYMAKWNIDYALKCIKEKNLDELVQSLEIDVELLKNISTNMYISKPNSEGLLSQNDQYFELDYIDLTEYKESDDVTKIFKDYNLEQINKIQVSKQADLLVLFLLFPDQFPEEVKRANYDFYEHRTLHDSSLSLSTHAILEADLGNPEKALAMFKKSFDIDLGENMMSSNEGIHIASLGGIWQTLTYAFLGIRITAEGLNISPNLPKEIKELKVRLTYHGCDLFITATDSNLILNIEENKKLKLLIAGKETVVEGSMVLEY
ncbi:MAG: glycosyl hydrolase family 65 protein [Coprobacillaceae bacterium]